MIFCARATRGVRRRVQRREKLSLLPERAPSEGPHSTAAPERNQPEERGARRDFARKESGN